MKFQSIFGSSKKDPMHVYCLLGVGYFRSARSENADSLINRWISEHPNAEVIPVSTSGGPKNKMTYCWLVDKKDTINVFLIKNGCFPGGTMMRPQTYDEMSPEMKKVYSRKDDVTIHIEKSKYDAFIEQVKQAEAEAEKQKLGVWSKVEDEE